MAFKLICVHPFHDRSLNKNFAKGEVVVDQQQVERLKEDRHKHFVKVVMTAEEEASLARPTTITDEASARDE